MSGGGFFKHYVKSEWSSTVFVAAIVTIFNVHFHWLAAIDAYAFVGFGNIASLDAAYASAPPSAIVVEIDSLTFERVYGERSPLPRCVLRDHLAAIYEAGPNVVAIDLDLSPAVWLLAGEPDPRGEAGCEKEIYDGIHKAALEQHISFVLMEPIPAADPQAAQRDPQNASEPRDCGMDKRCWKTKITEKASDKIQFANADLPVDYGLTLNKAKSNDADPSFAHRVAQMAHAPWNDTKHIDPRAYRSGVRLVEIKNAEPEDLTIEVDAALDWLERFSNESNEEDDRKRAKRVVFFGAAYGGGDIFLTPLGEMYGVEVHAASYASGRIDHDYLKDFLVDVFIASVFGLVIAYFWMRYFTDRLDREPTVRHRAKKWIVRLVGSVGLLVFLFGIVSLLALIGAGLWLSPIPIAIGMLIDSFVSGSVDQATHTCLETRKKLVAGVTFTETMVAIPSPPRFARWWRLGAKYLPDVIGGDLCEALLYRRPVTLVASWSALWVAAIALALYLALKVPA